MADDKHGLGDRGFHVAGRGRLGLRRRMHHRVGRRVRLAGVERRATRALVTALGGFIVRVVGLAAPRFAVAVIMIVVVVVVVIVGLVVVVVLLLQMVDHRQELRLANGRRALVLGDGRVAVAGQVLLLPRQVQHHALQRVLLVRHALQVRLRLLEKQRKRRPLGEPRRGRVVVGAVHGVCVACRGAATR